MDSNGTPINWTSSSTMIPYRCENINGWMREQKEIRRGECEGWNMSLRMDGWTEMEHLQLGITGSDGTDVVV